jgi:glycosyltransferase involved in cell wall biosynthesis
MVRSGPRILFVGNYSRDAQESMQRFARVMLAGVRSAGWEAELLLPPAVLGRWGKSTVAGLGKWLAYVDKFVLFPFLLRRTIRRLAGGNAGPLLVHICDHSNAMLAAWTRDVPSVITCHDLLAVRGALGEQTDCPASRAGTLLQRWIVRGLARASMIVCVSGATLRDVQRIVARGGATPRICLVHIGLNHNYRRLASHESEVRLAPLALPPAPFILHVGSNLRRKNREGVLRIFARLAPRWDGCLVFAGEPLTAELTALAESLRIAGRVRVVPKPDNAVLEALYNRALALLFPSRFEGFGWPIIEAQACGCPVICSDADPLPEIVGDSGIICPLEDEEAFTAAILQLTNSTERESWLRKGSANVSRFTTERMISDYLNIYGELGVNK